MKKILGFLVSTAFTGVVLISCSSSPKTADVAAPTPSAQSVTDADHPEEKVNSTTVARNEPVRSPNLGTSSSGVAK